jgi:mannose-6-phosphate isomerase-like protein (cupin superfamily)
VDRTLLARMRVDYASFKRIIMRTQTDEQVLAQLREIPGIATPENAWFDPIGRETELQRSDAPPVPAVVPGAELQGFDHGLIGVTLVRSTLAAGAARAAHQHPYDEVVLVESGTGLAHAGGRELALGEGDALTLSARTPHAFVNTGDAELRLLEIHANGRVLETLVG